MKKISRALALAAIGLGFSAFGWDNPRARLYYKYRPLSGSARGCSTAAGSNSFSAISWSFSEEHPAAVASQTVTRAKLKEFVLTKAFRRVQRRIVSELRTGSA